MAISRQSVDALKPGEFTWDRNLGVKCTDGGVKLFVLGYRIGRRRRRITIGEVGRPWSVQTAEKEAKRLLGEIAAGRDPLEAKLATRTAPTLGEILDRVEREHLPKLKAPTAREYRRIYAAHLRPKLGPRAVNAITRSDVAALHHALAATPRQANLVVSVLSKVMALAEAWGHRPDNSNPCAVVRFRETKRERYLDAAELARLGTALAEVEAAGTVSPHALAALKLLLFTGARVSEILGLRWDTIDLEAGVARLADSKTGAKTVHLPPPAVAVLRALPREAESPWVIIGRRAGSHLVNLAEPWALIREAAGLKDVRMHDLRHGFASVGVSGGLSLPVVGKLLGHRVASTTQRYAHVAADPVHHAADQIGTAIAAALAPARATRRKK